MKSRTKQEEIYSSNNLIYNVDSIKRTTIKRCTNNAPIKIFPLKEYFTYLFAIFYNGSSKTIVRAIQSFTSFDVHWSLSVNNSNWNSFDHIPKVSHTRFIAVCYASIKNRTSNSGTETMSTILSYRVYNIVHYHNSMPKCCAQIWNKIVSCEKYAVFNCCICLRVTLQHG